MFSLFTPVLKIQKNRQVLRDTDERMAKYSRRGLISNFVVFLLCMAVGSFVDKEPQLAASLTIGLLITTLLRGYLLFRFEVLYPKGPALWRTRYFYATLLGAGWWGLIIALETLIVGINDEGPLLWLYTIVFFAMTANAFAPYKQFLAIYQFLGLVPGMFCLLFIGEVAGIIYSIVVFFFIWLLHHQCEQTADNYWERLEANATLARKTESLEEEKRDTRAMAQLHQEYMLLLRRELEELLNARREEPRDKSLQANESTDTTGGSIELSATKDSWPVPLNRRTRLHRLHNNVADFHQILTKEIDLQEFEFNPKSLLKAVITEYAVEAMRQSIDIDLSISMSVPQVLQGDSTRLTQIVHAIMSSAIEQLDEGTLFIDIEYLQDRGTLGQLHILTTHQASGQRTLFASGQAKPVTLNLELALASGLAEAQGGEIEITTTRSGTQIRYRANYKNANPTIANQNPQRPFRGKRLFLVHENPRVLDAKRQELSQLGFFVDTETLFRRATTQIREAIAAQKPYHAVVFHAFRDAKATVDFSQSLANQASCKLVHQVIMAPADAKKLPEFDDIRDNTYIHWVDKPVISTDFHACFYDVFAKHEQDEDLTPVAVISENEATEITNILTAHGLSPKLFKQVKEISTEPETSDIPYFVFVGNQFRDGQAYTAIRHSHPEAKIIAVDLQKEIYSHLQVGADLFVPLNNTSKLMHYLRAL